MADRVATAWAALSEIFGRTLEANYGASAPPLWRAKIEGLTDAQLERGLRELSERDTGYAPTLGQFVSACRGDGLRRPPPGMLPAPRVDRWDAALNLLLLTKIQRARGVGQDTLRELVQYRRQVGRQLRDAYGDRPLPDADRDDVQAMEAGISAEMDRIIARDSRPEDAAGLRRWFSLPPGMDPLCRQQAERTIAEAEARERARAA